MAPFRRRDMLLAMAASALVRPALAEEDLVFRRTPLPGEDPTWYSLSQQGRFNPQPQPLQLPFGIARTIFHYPIGPKKGRLVVFSHAALADPLVYRPLLQHLASHGFIVAAPIHDDSVLERGLLTRTVASNGRASWDVDHVLNDVFAWEARCEGCRQVLEHVDRVSAAIGMEVDAERPIFLGHEFGAYVGQLLMGAVVDDNGGKLTRLADDRWYCGVLMSAQGAGIMGLTEPSWERVKRPLVVLQGALERDFTLQSPQAKADPFLRSQPGNKHLMWFVSGDHSMYMPARTPHSSEERVMVDDLKAAVTGACVAYGDYDAEVFKKLASDWPERATLGRVMSSYR